MNDAKRVLIICAHSDDQVIGAGGTTAKLAKQGAQIKTFICSFGEQSHPHLREIDVRKTRVRESQHADRILGGGGVLFLGMKEGHFYEEYKEKQWYGKLLHHIKVLNPDVILTHAPDDPHPDHRAVYKIVTDIYTQAKLSCEMYVFDIWTLFSITKRKNPKLLIDISHTFSRKLDALSAFRSQRVALFTLLWSVYAKAIYYGVKGGARYAEVMYKVR
jgi:LmbE family N-acetylglucosaminyl deacetylase